MVLTENLKKILLAGIGTIATTAEKSKEILDDMKKHFNAVKILKPQASRTNSFETFVIGLDKKA